MSLLGFDALGRLALGQLPSNAGTTITLTASPGSFVLTGQAATFTITEAAAVGSFVLTGVAASFTVSEAAAAGAFAFTGVAATFAVSEVALSGSFVLTGVAANDQTTEPAGSGSFILTTVPAPLIRTGDNTEQVYGGVGHYKLERERAKQLARITRNVPPPLDLRTKAQFAPFNGAPVAPAAPAVDLAAIHNQRMAAQLAAVQAAKKRRTEQAILLLAS